MNQRRLKQLLLTAAAIALLAITAAIWIDNARLAQQLASLGG